MKSTRVQVLLSDHCDEVNSGPRSPIEILAVTTEELGEVAQEVLLSEKVGSKRSWKKAGNVNAIGKELVDLIGNLYSLANYYRIDLDREILKRVAADTGGPPSETQAIGPAA